MSRSETNGAPRPGISTGMKRTKVKGARSVNAHSPTEPPSRTLVVDVGATGIKATLINDLGMPVGHRVRRETPPSGNPGEIIDIVVALSKQFESFDRVAVGFPGVIINGIVTQAPNLAPEWQDFHLAQVLQARLQKPVRVANDADVQGFGAISGTGVELVLTLGTGVGTSLFVDGRLVPNLEIGKDTLRNKALQKAGKKKWNRRLAKYVKKLDSIFHFTRLHIGGGNSQKADLGLLPPNVTIVSNMNGLIGGIALWRYTAEKSVEPPIEVPQDNPLILKRV